MDGPPVGVTLVGYRIADWHAAMRVNPSRSEGRFHRLGEVVQYLCLHPYGPYAEHLRNHPVGPEFTAELRLRLWAVQFRTEGIVPVADELAEKRGITADELVNDDFTACQDLASRLRADGASGLLVPSAALPGTYNVVLFGPRVGVAYQETRLLASSVPCAVAAEDARPPHGLYDRVRFHGDTYVPNERFIEPPLPIQR